MTAGSDVLVVGGGAVGSSCARALALAGGRVTSVYPDALPGEAWRTAAGMLAAQIESGPEEPLFRMAVAGRSFYAREAPALLETTGIDIGLRLEGILQVADSAAQAEAFKAKVAWQRQQAQQADWLEPEEVAESWPALLPAAGAFWAAEDGQLAPESMVAALRADATRLGARTVSDRVVSLLRDGNRVTGVQTEGGELHADLVILAAGAWSGRIAGLPRPLTVEPVRGQMLAFARQEGLPDLPVYGDHCYILPRGDELVAGATMEHAGFDVGTTDDGLSHLRRRLNALAPQLADLEPIRVWSGLRPGTPDGLPIIGPEPRLAGLWYATGHGRNGILLAGVTGEVVARCIAGEPISEELRATRASRYWAWQV